MRLLLPPIDFIGALALLLPLPFVTFRGLALLLPFPFVTFRGLALLLPLPFVTFRALGGTCPCLRHEHIPPIAQDFLWAPAAPLAGGRRLRLNTAVGASALPRSGLGMGMGMGMGLSNSGFGEYKIR